MRNEDQTYSLIEDYLSKKLQGDELLVFKKEYGQNQNLRRKVEMHKLANEMVIENRIHNIQILLSQEKINYSKSILLKKIISGITGGLLIATILFFITDKNKSNNTIDNKLHTNQKALNIKNILSDPENKDDNVEQIKNIYKPLPSTRKISEEDKSNVYTDNDFTNVGTTEKEAVSDYTTNIQQNEGVRQEQISEVINPCDKLQITADISVKPSCKDENNGAIIISGFKGGFTPYSYYISDGNHEYENSRLSAGVYSVLITDSKGCKENILNVHVSEQYCHKDYSFNPFIGESWEIPSCKSSGTLILYDEAGNIYFSQEISSGANEQWSGQSKTGEVKIGYFLFVINYKDGTVRNGSVTIVR